MNKSRRIKAIILFLTMRNQKCVGKRVRDLEVRGKRNRGRPKMRYIIRGKKRFEREESVREPRPKPRILEKVGQKFRPHLSGKTT